MQRRWVAVQGRRLRHMRGDAVNQQKGSAAASQVPPDANGFGVQQLQADGGGAADADDSDGSIPPYGQDDDDFTWEDEVCLCRLCVNVMLTGVQPHT